MTVRLLLMPVMGLARLRESASSAEWQVRSPLADAQFIVTEDGAIAPGVEEV